ncbi:hypothetical protein GEMRC1_004693 [Eukaryota sp. GEM-RC1]
MLDYESPPDSPPSSFSSTKPPLHPSVTGSRSELEHQQEYSSFDDNISTEFNRKLAAKVQRQAASLAEKTTSIDKLRKENKKLSSDLNSTQKQLRDAQRRTVPSTPSSSTNRQLAELSTEVRRLREALLREETANEESKAYIEVLREALDTKIY